MLFTEFDMDTAKKIWKEEAREEGRNEGIAEGRNEGRNEGKKEKQIEIAKNLLVMLDVKDINIISKATGLSIEEINKLM